MKEFFMTVIPWLIAGLCAAALIVLIFRRRRKEKNDEWKETYILEGMCLGICFGALLGQLGIIRFGAGPSVGMLIGEVIGMKIPKKKEEK